jgi:RecA/RadA recombinase
MKKVFSNIFDKKLMLKLGEIFLVSVEGAVVDREAGLDPDNRVDHWRSVRSLLIAQPPVSVC